MKPDDVQAQADDLLRQLQAPLTAEERLRTQAPPNTHVADDERHERGEPIPRQGTPIDPNTIPGDGPADPFEGRWKTLGQWGADWLSTAPQRRRWLLERPNEETGGRGNPVGVLPLGKVGMLVAAGGAGKTMALVQLALSVATGRKWLDHFETPNHGHVLLALGEEDEEEIRRRMYNAACAMRLTDEQKRLAAERIVALPLAGTSVALTESDGRNTAESAALHALRKRLNSASHEWRLVILDPLSRFAGCDTEKDNAAATRFIEAAESLVRAPGSPTVLLAHHTNKVSRTNESEASAADARGASGLTDGARWAASLTRDSDDRATFKITKSNYGPWGSPVVLVRDADYGGSLRAERPQEKLERESKDNERKSESAKLPKPRDEAKA